MLLAVSFMLSLLLNRYQGLATRQRVLSAAGHVALGYAFLVDVGTLEAELILLLAVALGMGEAIGSAILLAERAFVSTSITLALEPANNALRLATYRAGELAPTIAWSRVKLLEQIGVGAFGTVGMLVASGSYSTSESSGSSPSATGTAATASVSGPKTLIGSFRSTASACADNNTAREPPT